MKKWVVVADKSQAKIYSTYSDVSRLVPVGTVLNSKARMKQGDLVSDRSGSVMIGSRYRNLSSLGQKKCNVDEVGRVHVRNISQYLKQLKNQSAFSSFIVIAEPGLIGALAFEFDKSNLKISDQILKKYTQLTDDEILVRLRKYLNID